MLGDSIGAAFERSLRVNAARVAIEFGGETTTFAELDLWSEAIAASLREAGVGPGVSVALLAGNSPGFIAADVAIARLGAVKVPVNQLLPAPTISFILENSAARAAVVAPELADLAVEAVALSKLPPALFTLGDAPRLADISTALPGPEAGSGALRAEPVDELAPAAIYYTGGTTGRPKGARHTQASVVGFHLAQLLEAEIRQGERMLLATPLAHAAGLFAQSAVLRGATVLLRDGFDAEDTLAALEREAVSWTFLVPTMIYRLLDCLGGREPAFPRLDTIVYGAAPISSARLGQALDCFGQVFVQLYGQTESPNWGTRLGKRDHDPARPERLLSCGQPSIMAAVKVVDEEGEELPAGEVGEVCLRTPYLLEGYQGDEEATREKFLGDWIKTGDVGVLDADRYLYLKDRRADMVISGGMNVYCSEVENALQLHPGVRAVAVIGVPHEDWGEAVHAVVVADGAVTEEELLAWSRGKVASYARPKSVEFVAELPETPFGKVDKKRLRSPYWRDADRAIG